MTCLSRRARRQRPFETRRTSSRAQRSPAAPWGLTGLAAALLTPACAAAQTFDWVPASGQWSTAANWSPASVPPPGSFVSINRPGGANVVCNTNYGSPLASVVVEGTTGAAVTTINIVSGAHLRANDEIIGRSSHASLTQSAGTHTIAGGDGELTLGDLANGVGSYTMSGGTLAAQRIIVARMGRGNFRHSGGTVTLTGSGFGEGLFLNSYDGLSGSYELSGNATLRSNRVVAGGDIEPSSAENSVNTVAPTSIPRGSSSATPTLPFTRWKAAACPRRAWGSGPEVIFSCVVAAPFSLTQYT
jgi:hypothetical protein